MRHYSVMVLLDTLMSLALPRVSLGLLTVILDHGLLNFGAGTFALVCSHAFFMLFQTVLNTFDRVGVRVKCFAVLANYLLQPGQLGES